MKIKLFDKNTNEELIVLEGQIEITEESIKDETGNGVKGYNPAIVGYEVIGQDAPTVEELITQKTREIAVTALKAEGKLDADGKIKKEK